MQSQRQYFSRLGTAFLRRSDSTSRLPYSALNPPPVHVLNTRRYLRIRAIFSRSDRVNQIEDTTRRQRLVYRPLQYGSFRGQAIDETIGKTSSINPEPEEESVSDNVAALQNPTQDQSTTKLERQVQPPKEEVLRLRAKRRTKAKEQRMRAQARKSEAPPIEDSIGDAGVLPESHSQAPTGKAHGELWAAKNKLTIKAKGQQRRSAKKEAPTVREQFETIEQQFKMIDQELQMIARRIAIWKDLGVVEMLIDRTRCQLELVGRRIETWRQLDMADKKLVHTEMQLEMFRGWLDLTRQGRETADESGLRAKRISPLVDEASDVAENSREGSANTQSDVTIQSVPGSFLIRRVDLRRRAQKSDDRNLMKQATGRKGVTVRHHARPLSTPSHLLARWLDTKDTAEREQYWLKNRAHHRLSSLPLVLVVYLRRSANPDLPLDEFDQSCLDASTATLHQRGLSLKDVAEWAWILSAQDTTSMINRFTSTISKKPTFVLLEILRRDISDVRSLKLLFNYCWDLFQGRLGSSLIVNSDAEAESIIPQSTPSHASQSIPHSRPLKVESNSFFRIFRALLHQARCVWPLAIVSISHMVAPFIDLQLGKISGELRQLDNLTHARLCEVFNRMLRELAVPASINPYKSMVYNWQAQRILLEMTTQFQPPLILDRNSYRAVAQVLAASKKSERESKAAMLRTRSWPPWRVDQDGMDAQRSPEDDMSRALAITIQAKESGYSEDEQDRAMRVLGGQEPDGTPTIPTRRLFRFRRRRRSIGPFQSDPDARHWAARIESTRDVQEAWSAFNSYQETGRHPPISMYFAMITKLQFEEARIGRLKQHSPSPGNGKEVLQPPDDNFSTFYRTRLQPPTSAELYQQMRLAEYRPSGRFLIFLIQHARTPSQARLFMADARISHLAIAVLKGSMTIPQDFLKLLPTPIFAAYVTMLCRFAPRAILVPLQEESAAKCGDSPVKSEWKIHELRSHNQHQRGLDIFLRVAELLKTSQPRFRPVWYAFFSALARRDVVVDRSLVGHPKNDILAWKVLVAALNDFHNCGLELDPRGFMILCNGLEKAILASFKIPGAEREQVFDKSQMRIVVDEFMRLSEIVEPSHPTIPTLLHPIEGAHLHAYVRVLGLAEDYEGLMYVLRWMVQHYVVLGETATQAHNGLKLIQRTIIAIKVFLGRTEHEAEAEELVNRVEHWGGWPADSEAQEYINSGTGWPEGDDNDVEQENTTSV